MNMGRLILEVGDNWGDEPSSATGGDGSGRDLEDSPEPDFRARLEGRALLVVSKAPEKEPEVPSWSDIAGMPEAPRVWQLGPMQAMYLQVGPANGHLQPWKCLHPPSLGC